MAAGMHSAHAGGMKHRQKHHADKTLQDDRTTLGVDADEDSPLVKGEGAPLAEDGVTTDPKRKETVVAPTLLGGAPIASVMAERDSPAPRDPMTAREDRPIND
jgi:hypothetical protein